MLKQVSHSRRHMLITLATLLLLVWAAPGAALGQGASYTVNQDFPIQIYVYVPCANGGAGEDIFLTGTLHDLFHFSFDGSGGYHYKYHDNPQGLRGYGLVTGAKYQGTGVTQGQLTGKVGVEETYVNNFRMVGQGPGNNFAIHENYHIRVNANGTLTAYVDNYRVSCK